MSDEPPPPAAFTVASEVPVEGSVHGVTAQPVDPVVSVTAASATADAVAGAAAVSAVERKDRAEDDKWLMNAIEGRELPKPSFPAWMDKSFPGELPSFEEWYGDSIVVNFHPTY